MATTFLLILKARLINFLITFVLITFLVRFRLFLCFLLFPGLTFTVRAIGLVCLLIVRFIVLFLFLFGFLFLLLQIINRDVFEVAILAPCAVSRKVSCTRAFASASPFRATVASFFSPFSSSASSAVSPLFIGFVCSIGFFCLLFSFRGDVAQCHRTLHIDVVADRVRFSIVGDLFAFLIVSLV